MINVYGLRRSGLHAITGWIHKHYPGWRFENECQMPVPPRLRNKQLKLFEEHSPNLVMNYMETHPKQKHVVVLRDPYNWAASRLKRNFKIAGTPRSKIYMPQLNRFYNKSWFQGTVYLNYNKWVMSKPYRIDIAKQIGFKTDGSPYLKVQYHGGGSSFDGQRFSGRARQMDLFHRYKDYLSDPEYLNLDLWGNTLFKCSKELFNINPPKQLCFWL
jgi:hypothetical protein